MFKSTFAKYMTAFITVILVSFIILSSVVTTTIRSHVAEKQAEELYKTGSAIAEQFEDLKVADIENHILSGLSASAISVLVNRESDLNIIITDPKGRILLKTVPSLTGTEEKRIVTSSDLGEIDFSVFSESKTDKGEMYRIYKGVIDTVSDQRQQMCAKEIVTDDVIRGYVVSVYSAVRDDGLVTTARRALINNALWVMLAAVIAVYFTTERIIHPLKNMTSAAKSFAKGDFSTRVTVYGEDEVSELAEAFNNMAESLDSFEKMRNSFLANVSHDLRTPMTTISGFIDGITSGAIPPEKHDYYLRVISDEVHRLSRLVTDLLDISRLESGERKFNFERFDVAEMARIILISFEQSIEEKHLDVMFESDSDVMMVYADKDAIHQVIYNLCHNAIKFAKDGGKFAISITVDLNKKTRISVYDEGVSINREELPFIFDRFYKTDKSRGLDKTGVGLGLYICKTIIDAHGEEIRAESPNDNGAEFWFTLSDSDPRKRQTK